MMIIPFNTVRDLAGLTGWYEISNFAVDHGLMFNSFPTARLDYDMLRANDNINAELVRNGAISQDGLFILDSIERGEELGLTMEEIDGYWIGSIPK